MKDVLDVIKKREREIEKKNGTNAYTGKVDHFLNKAIVYVYVLFLFYSSLSLTL
jgi:hypothetical protein